MTEAEAFLTENGLPPSSMDCWGFDREPSDRAIRNLFVERFGFAVLTSAVVAYIGRFSPLLEVGSGSGYWAYELGKAGIDIIATDPGTGRYVNTPKWPPYCTIEPLTGVEAVAKYPGRNLLTVWPDMDEWPQETLRAFAGEIVLYVGEGEGGCTADSAFHEYLGAAFTLRNSIKIPQFLGIRDELHVWTRNR